MRTLLAILLIVLAAGCHKDHIVPKTGPKVEEYSPPPPLK